MSDHLQNIPNGFVHLWEALGWKQQRSMEGTGHGRTLMKWEGEGDPVFPTTRGEAEHFHSEATVARVAAITEPADGEFYIMLGEGDGECTRWLLSGDLARKIRRELHDALDW
jgi:hypothetical protein